MRLERLQVACKGISVAGRCRKPTLPAVVLLFAAQPMNGNTAVFPSQCGFVEAEVAAAAFLRHHYFIGRNPFDIAEEGIIVGADNPVAGRQCRRPFGCLGIQLVPQRRVGGWQVVRGVFAFPYLHIGFFYFGGASQLVVGRCGA